LDPEVTEGALAFLEFINRPEELEAYMVAEGVIMKNKWTKIWVTVFLAPTIIVFCLFYIIPIITVFITGFMNWDGYYTVSVCTGTGSEEHCFKRYKGLVQYRNKISSHVCLTITWLLELVSKAL